MVRRNLDESKSRGVADGTGAVQLELCDIATGVEPAVGFCAFLERPSGNWCGDPPAAVRIERQRAREVPWKFAREALCGQRFDECTVGVALEEDRPSAGFEPYDSPGRICSENQRGIADALVRAGKCFAQPTADTIEPADRFERGWRLRPRSS